MIDLVLSTVEFGDHEGPPLLAVHGGGTRGQRWARMGTEGLPDRRWICPDLRGFGDSPKVPPFTIAQHARDIGIMLDALGLSCVDLIGLSFGGRVVMEVCRERPSRVRSAVLIDPPLMTTEEWLEFGSQHPILMAGYEREYDSLEEFAAAFAGDGAITDLSSLSPAERQHVEKELTDILVRTETGRFRYRADPEAIRQAIEEVGKVPASVGAFPGEVLLLVAGGFDAVTEKGFEAFQSQLSDRLTTVTLDTSHALIEDDFEGAVAQVARFLDDQDRRG